MNADPQFEIDSSSAATSVDLLLLIPAGRYSLPISLPFYSWESGMLEDAGYAIEERYSDTQKVQIIQEFAQKILDGIEEIDPEIAKVINDKFWDLL
jgi:hypothetical protein